MAEASGTTEATKASMMMKNTSMVASVEANEEVRATTATMMIASMRSRFRAKTSRRISTTKMATIGIAEDSSKRTSPLVEVVHDKPGMEDSEAGAGELSLEGLSPNTSMTTLSHGRLREVAVEAELGRHPNLFSQRPSQEEALGLKGSHS